MHSEDTKIIAFNQYQKSVKTLFISYADLECLREKNDRYKNNPKNLSTTKVGENIPSGFWMSIILLFKSKKKHGVCRGKDCMKKFYESLRQHSIEIIKFKKKKNEVINKRAAGITWKCKNLSQL